MKTESTIKEYTLQDLISLFLSKLFTIIAVTLVFGVAAYCIAYWVMPRKYSSHISMYVQSYTAEMADSASSAELRGSVSTSKQLLNTYIEVLKDDAVMTDVGNQLAKYFTPEALRECFSLRDGSPTPSSLRSCIRINAVTDTTVLTVTTTTKNAEISAAVCNYLSRVAQKYLDKAVGVGSINYIATARIYETPVSPNIPRITVMGAGIGFALIILEILAIDFFDNTIKGTQDLSDKFNIASLGEIQSMGGGDKKKNKKKGAKNNDRSKMLLTDKNTPFNVIESYKSIRTNITFGLSTQKRKVFAVSSANPGEGKSTTAANIAIAFSQAESKVLLIDADMRKPVQHKTFRVSNIDGLSTLIGKMSTMEDAIKRNVLPHLDVLPAGTCPPNPSELLASEQFAELIETLSSRYDYIIIDTPPVNVVSDAIVLRDVIGGVLFVLRYGSTTYDDVDEAMKKVELAEAKTIGFIMNDVKFEHRGGYYARDKYSYYKYGYSKKGYGYGYGSNKPKDQNPAND